MTYKIIIINGHSSAGKTNIINHLLKNIPRSINVGIDNIWPILTQVPKSVIFKTWNKNKFFLSNTQQEIDKYINILQKDDLTIYTKIMYSNDGLLLLKNISSIVENLYNNFHIFIDDVIDSQKILNNYKNLFSKIVFIKLQCSDIDINNRELQRQDRPIGLGLWQKKSINKFKSINYYLTINTSITPIEKIIKLIKNII